MTFNEAINDVLRYTLSDHQSFHNAIVDNPEAEVPHLAYADFVQENGNERAANLIRKAVAEGYAGQHQDIDGVDVPENVGDFHIYPSEGRTPNGRRATLQRVVTRSGADPDKALVWYAPTSYHPEQLREGPDEISEQYRSINKALKYYNETHSDFLDRIHQNPEEDVPHLAYADWLEENGQPKHAEFIRNVIAGRQQRRNDWSASTNAVRTTSAEPHAPTDFATHGYFDYDKKSHIDLSNQHPNESGNRLFWTMGPLTPEEGRRIRDELAAEGATAGPIAGDNSDPHYKRMLRRMNGEIEEGPDEIGEQFSRSERPIRYAAVPEHDIHPDYTPNGIAPRVGHALNQLATEEGEHAALAEGILRTGDHSLLPIMADMLDEKDHPAKEQFDWRHIPRGIRTDRALQQVIDNHRQTVDIHPAVVAHNWRTGSRFRISRRKAKDAIKKVVPDVNNNDLVHSILRLSLNAGINDGITKPDVSPEWFTALHNQYAKELGSDVPNPHSYTDTRPVGKRIYESESKPVQYRKSKKWLSEKIRKLRNEGRPEDQSVVIAERMAGAPKKYANFRSPADGMVVKASPLAVTGAFIKGGQFAGDLTKTADSAQPKPKRLNVEYIRQRWQKLNRI